MSTDAPFQPPRKKINILWWLAGFFLLLVLMFIFQLFGPNPRIVVSPQTTYITEPLRPDGLPDYERYVLELYRDGVTPENNAATLLFQALWPGELDPPQYAAVATELGWDRIPSERDALAPLYKSTHGPLASWLRQHRFGQHIGQADPSPDDVPVEHEMTPLDNQWLEHERHRILEEAADNIIDQAMSRPWTSLQVPPLAKWVAENQKPLDLIVEAAGRPRCHLPSPSLLDNQPDMLIAVLLPGQQAVREAARSLSARAMWHLGEGRIDDAWQDLLAVHRLGFLVAQGHTLVEQLIGIAISGIACQATQTLLDHSEMTVEQARQIMRDLAALEGFSGMAGSLDFMERAMYLDSMTYLSRRNTDETAMEWYGIVEGATILSIVSVDWNHVMRKGNEFYDRLAAAARMPDRAAREQAFSQIETDLAQFASNVRTPGTLFAAAISPSARSDAVAAIMVGLFLPAHSAAMTAQDRGNAILELARLAAALAVYRAEHGAYPETLDDLVPGVLDALPVDPYNAQPYFYQRDDEGYLLYTAGENGIDDGGSNEHMSIFQGRSLDDLGDAAAERLRPKIPAGADDFSIRVPRPKLELPKIAPPAGEL